MTASAGFSGVSYRKNTTEIFQTKSAGREKKDSAMVSQLKPSIGLLSEFQLVSIKIIVV